MRGNEPVGNLQELIRTACTLLLFLTFCLGTLGNLIVFFSFFDPALRKLRTNFDFMVLNLSFCDLFICCVTTPMFAFILYFDSNSNVSGAFCFTFHLTSAALIIMSLKSVTIIGLHRLYMVLCERRPNTTVSRSILLVTISLWSLSFTLGTLATFWTSPESSRVCVPLFGCTSSDDKVILYLYVADYAFCVGAVLVSYMIIAVALKKNTYGRKSAIITVDPLSPRVLKRAGTNRGQTVTEPLYQNQNYNKLQHTQAHSYKQGRTPIRPSENKLQLGSSMNISGTKDSGAVVTCVVVVVSVIVCCLPLGFSFLQDVTMLQSSFILNQFKLFGFTLILFKSGLNPFIYSRSSAGLRKRILWCRQCVSLGCCCYKHKTWLLAVGQGSLDVNRNKASHYETNSAYMLSPQPQRKLVDQNCAQNNSNSISIKVETCCSTYNSPSQKSGILLPMNIVC
ncbi:probable G-protein coupled receptor 75 [Narcine bancroftii]|uniref:probable G-protein coupled receptor 75 n=1 Tax=Narcine bancroftii TaxID=1343680 RepID=UPI003831D592